MFIYLSMASSDKVFKGLFWIVHCHYYHLKLRPFNIKFFTFRNCVKCKHPCLNHCMYALLNFKLTTQKQKILSSDCNIEILMRNDTYTHNSGKESFFVYVCKIIYFYGCFLFHVRFSRFNEFFKIRILIFCILIF